MQARDAPAAFALVLDVVVDQKGVMEKLQSGCRGKRVLQLAPKRPACRNQKRRANSLAGLGAEVAHRLVEVHSRFAVGQTLQQGAAGKAAVFGKSFEKDGLVHRPVRLSG